VSRPPVEEYALGGQLGTRIVRYARMRGWAAVVSWLRVVLKLAEEELAAEDRRRTS
jgi:hypothetical protein